MSVARWAIFYVCRKKDTEGATVIRFRFFALDAQVFQETHYGFFTELDRGAN